MHFRLSVVAFVVGCALAAVPGCASEDARVDPLSGEDGDNEGASESELRANALKLLGAWRGDGQLQPPRFRGIVFNANGTFFSDIDTGRRCQARPGQGSCNAFVDIEGTFKATASYVTLSPKAGMPDPGDGFYGKYKYKVAGGKLTFTRSDFASEWSNPFTKQGSYCARESDCDRQSIGHVECVGLWTCVDPLASTCVWDCSNHR